jgi:flavin reductase (DIM6/NTAB) family NADH-FMN oxidoreductase RutF
MTRDIPADLWKRMTSTVGLVSVRHHAVTNVMSAEWSYFVNKAPLYAAVVLSPRAVSRQFIAAAGHFSLTLCTEDQAELADFAGSFSWAEIDKTTSELVTFGQPEAIASPWVTGGLLAVECVLRQTVEFPVHRMYVGEVVAAHVPDAASRPLVKHGAVYSLGDPLRRTAIVTAAQLLLGGVLRVVATSPATADGPWRVCLLSADGDPRSLGEYPTGDHEDFSVEVALPGDLAVGRLRDCRVRVERDGAKPGHASIAGTGR